MPVELMAHGMSSGVAFLVAAGIVYEIIAAACSSPQTTEINAKSRSGTLMKWVNIGIGQSVLFIAIAACLDPGNAGAYIAGGLLAGGLMYVQYVHARTAGLRSAEPGTETTEPGAAASVRLGTAGTGITGKLGWSWA